MKLLVISPPLILAKCLMLDRIKDFKNQLESHKKRKIESGSLYSLTEPDWS